jgi:hypothetical protein
MAESLFQSPLRRSHDRASRFHRLALGAHLHSDLLHGERVYQWPLLALQTTQDLGNCRHALSQMVVAGTMSVYPPVQVSPNPQTSNDASSQGEGE